jgi:hypothetical protein
MIVIVPSLKLWWHNKFYVTPPRNAKRLTILKSFVFTTLSNPQRKFIRFKKDFDFGLDWNTNGFLVTDELFRIGDVILFPQAFNVRGYYVVNDIMIISSVGGPDKVIQLIYLCSDQLVEVWQ